MRSIKVFYHGKRLKDIYPHATWWEVVKFKTMKFIRKLVILTVALSLFAGVNYGFFHVGRASVEPKIVRAEVEVIKEIEGEYPVLNRIAKCESGGKHVKDGQVIFNANTNKTVDIGLFQINSIWNKKASEMGLDLTKEADNRAFATWLYKNKGTAPWSASAHCWSI